jgi:hypothetical protein
MIPVDCAVYLRRNYRDHGNEGSRDRPGAGWPAGGATGRLEQRRPSLAGAHVTGGHVEAGRGGGGAHRHRMRASAGGTGSPPAAAGELETRW